MAVNFDQIPCVDGRIVGVRKRRVLRRRTVTDDGLDGMRMVTIDVDDVGSGDVVGRVDRCGWFRRRRAMAGEGVDSSSSPTSRPPLRLPLRAARVLASCVMHRLREDAVDGELI